MKIVGDSEKKTNLLIIILPIVVVLIGLTITFFYFKGKNDNLPIESTVLEATIPQNTEEYAKESAFYSEQSIAYNYEDYLQDQTVETSINQDGVIIKESVSDAAQQLVKTNDDILKDIETVTLIETNSEEVIASICKQTLEMNDFIDSFLGWPSGDEYPDTDYSNSRLYISQLIGSMDGTSEEPINFYPNLPISDQQAAVRYSIVKQEQYHLGNASKLYYDTLFNYMKIGHPKINTINAIVLSYGDVKVFDGLTSNLQAKISTDNGNYFIYLISSVPDSGTPEFKILDINIA